MKHTKLLLMLSLFVILMSVCGSVFAQDNSNPGIKVKEVITDEKIVLITKNFPADTTYTVSLASEENPEAYTAVARFNSKSGGSTITQQLIKNQLLTSERSYKRKIQEASLALQLEKKYSKEY